MLQKLMSWIQWLQFLQRWCRLLYVDHVTIIMLQKLAFWAQWLQKITWIIICCIMLIMNNNHVAKINILSSNCSAASIFVKITWTTIIVMQILMFLSLMTTIFNQSLSTLFQIQLSIHLSSSNSHIYMKNSFW